MSETPRCQFVAPPPLALRGLLGSSTATVPSSPVRRVLLHDLSRHDLHESVSITNHVAVSLCVTCSMCKMTLQSNSIVTRHGHVTLHDHSVSHSVVTSVSRSVSVSSVTSNTVPQKHVSVSVTAYGRVAWPSAQGPPNPSRTCEGST